MMLALALALAVTAAPPTPSTYVTDNAGALSATARDAVENELEDFKKKTGNQVIVWIGDTTGGEPLETFTSQAADAWKIGRAHKDDGAILFLFMHDHKVRIEVGYGLEPKLTDAQSARIINDIIVPAMRKDDADTAVRNGVIAMLSVIDPTYAPPPADTSEWKPPSDDDDNGDAIAGIVILLLLVGIVFAIILTIVRRGKLHHDWLDGFLISSAAGPSDWSAGVHGSFGGGGGGGGSFGGGGGFGGGGASGGW
jgi:uncharacterized protein